MKNKFKAILSLFALVAGSSLVHAETSADAVSKTSGDVSVTGVVTARVIVDENKGLFFLQDAAGGVGVSYSGDTSKLPKAGYEIKLTGEATSKSFINYKSMSLVSTNKALPKLTVIRDASDTASVDGAVAKYAVIPKAKLSAGTFKTGEPVKLTASGADFKTIVSKPLNGRTIPEYEFNFFGVVTSDDIIGGDGSSKVLIPTRIVPGTATATRKFATTNTCFTCHQLDKKLVGPAYLWVAEKYKNDKEAIPKMIDQIENGGMNKWGPIPMIGFKGRLNNDQMTDLASWIHEMRWQLILNE